jgi:hypothetical protein
VAVYLLSMTLPLRLALETKSKLDSKYTRKTKTVQIPCGWLHVRCVLLFNKAGVEDPRGILDRLHDRKFALENLVSCDRVFEM